MNNVWPSVYILTPKAMPPGIQRGFPSGDIWQCQTTYLTAISGKFAISIQWVKPDMLLDCLPMFRTVPTTIIIWSQMAAAVSMRNISSVIIVIIIFISNAVLHTWPSVCRVCFVVSLCQWTKYFPTKMSCFFFLFLHAKVYFHVTKYSKIL